MRLSTDTRVKDRRAIQVVHFAPFASGNPYQELLADALKARGVEYRPAKRLRLRDVVKADRSREMFHLHWLEMIVRSNSRSRLATPYGVIVAAHLLLAVTVARMRGVRVVWTAHNLAPHESKRRRLDRSLGKAVARMAETVLVHSRHAADLARREFGRTDIEVAYHGNYIGHYPGGRPPAEVRGELGLPGSAHVFLAFGLVRDYKRLPELIASFRLLQGDGFRLLVAGKPIHEDVRQQVEAAAAADPRVLLLLERIPDDRVVESHEAADIATLAYEDVFSSGALMLALSCGLPVIAAADSTATELAPPPAVQPYRPDRLATAMEASREGGKGAGRLALEAAEKYDWDQMAARLLGTTA